MRVSTFDLETGKPIEGEVVSASPSGLLKVKLDDGRVVVRKKERTTEVK